MQVGPNHHVSKPEKRMLLILVCVTHPICIRPMSSMCVFWVSWLVWTWDGRTSPSYLAGTLFACFLCVSFCTNFLKHNMCALIRSWFTGSTRSHSKTHQCWMCVRLTHTSSYSWKTRLTAGSCWSCWTILMDFFLNKLSSNTFVWLQEKHLKSRGRTCRP